MTKYNERRQEAEDTLRKLREFYSENNLIYDTNPRARNLVYYRVLNRSGNENPIKSLKRIKKSMPYRAKYSLDEILPQVEKYCNMSEEEKGEVLQKRARSSNVRKNLENWVREAEPILVDILEKNTHELDGMSYQTLGSDTPGYEWHYHYSINSKDGSLKVSKWTGEGQYYHDCPIPKKEVAQEMLGEIGGYFYDYRELLSKKNHLRNELVREIERRTGRNLKREVYEARQSPNNERGSQ